MHDRDEPAVKPGRRVGAVLQTRSSGEAAIGTPPAGMRLLRLQQLAGNAAVAGLISAQRAPAPAPSVQGTCGCGGDCCVDTGLRTDEEPAEVQREGNGSPASPPAPAGAAELPGAPAACVTSTAIPADRSGIIRTASGMVGEKLSMNAEWSSAPYRGESSYCAAECGEYRQYVRGHMLASSNPDGRLPEDVSAVTADGQKLDQSTFKEDALDGDPARRYGHRQEQQKGADRYDPDPRRSGPTYRGSDFPNINIGTWADIDLEFLGKTIDVCNGAKETSSHSWTVRYTGVIRP
jgi:hypothetical protein